MGRFGPVGHVLALFMARYHVYMHFGWVSEPALPGNDAFFTNKTPFYKGEKNFRLRRAYA
jgi:hypothetical protein